MAIAAAAVTVLPGVVAAHPLGNFTINHYAGIAVTADRVTLDVVIDQAEIPAFQTRQAMDTDGDGALSPAEADAGRIAACADLRGQLDLVVGGVRSDLTDRASALSFPPGAGGLTTLRLECGYVAVPAAAIGPSTTVVFTDRSFAERIGWREIVVDPSSATVTGAGVRTTGVSDRLTHYPTDLLTAPLDDRSVTFTASPGAVAAAPAIEPISPGSEAVTDARAATASVPGGVLPDELPDAFRAADLTPLVLLSSLLVAAALGAGHALTPGHGKTLMAAYLVGTRGTARHAVGLGLSVTASHTIGILVLAAVIVGAQGVLAPDVVVRMAPIAAAVSIVAIGGWMLAAEIRRRRATGAHGAAHHHEAPHEHEHEHTHGGITHIHPPPATESTITWRGLFALGLAGGLIPSTSALLILLGAIAGGRPALGFVLIVAFGLGMAVVMGGIGLALVMARGRLDRFEPRSRFGRVAAAVPLVAAVVVLGFGLYLTATSVGGAVTL